MRGPYGSYRWSVWFTHVVCMVHVLVRRIFRSVKMRNSMTYKDWERGSMPRLDECPQKHSGFDNLRIPAPAVYVRKHSLVTLLFLLLFPILISILRIVYSRDMKSISLFL